MSGQGWEYEGRHFSVTAFSDVSKRDGYGWELEDVGPAPGRGVVCEAFLDDSTGQFTFTALTTDPLPFALIEGFVMEAAKDIPPR